MHSGYEYAGKGINYFDVIDDIGEKCLLLLLTDYQKHGNELFSTYLKFAPKRWAKSPLLRQTFINGIRRYNPPAKPERSAPIRKIWDWYYDHPLNKILKFLRVDKDGRSLLVRPTREWHTR